MMTNSLVVLTSDRAGEHEEFQQGQTAFSSCEYNYPIKALFQDFTSSHLICACYFFMFCSHALLKNSKSV